MLGVAVRRGSGDDAHLAKGIMYSSRKLVLCLKGKIACTLVNQLSASSPSFLV